MAVIMITLCSLISLAFIVMDLLPRYAEKQWKVFWVYTILISIAFVIHILLALDFKIPSPAVPIKKVVSYIFRLQD